MAAKKKTTRPDVTYEELQSVAEDFNSFMFETGGIDLELGYDDLLAEVVESAGELEDTDTISASTADTLTDLDLDFKAIISESEEGGEEVVEDDPVEEEEVVEEAPVEESKDAADLSFLSKTRSLAKMLILAKTHKIPVPPPFRKDIGKLKTYLIDKISNADPVVAGKDAKAKVEKEAKAKEKKKPGVMEALREITCADETITQEELTKQIEADGYKVTQRTIFSVLTDTQKIIAQLKAIGRLKK